MKTIMLEFESNSKKVYCKKCKYINYTDNKHTCNTKKDNFTFDNYYEKRIIHQNDESCYEKNKNNDCKDYKFNVFYKLRKFLYVKLAFLDV